LTQTQRYDNVKVQGGAMDKMVEKLFELFLLVVFSPFLLILRFFDTALPERVED
jgi:hypothetical protein